MEKLVMTPIEKKMEVVKGFQDTGAVFTKVDSER
jgi:hypothetical protein